jgi:hypothetical protein
LLSAAALLIGRAQAAGVGTNDVERPLRYRAEGTDFVIENGAEFFNRPIYGINTAFRVDGGDKPEFAFYLPGRGGNLRLGIRAGERAKWLQGAKSVVARYRPGSLVYEVRDPLLGAGVLRVTALGLADAEGLIVRAEILGSDAEDVSLIAAFGGANGDKGSRNVDIGCEPVPVSQWFQLKPAYCAGNQFSIDGPTFVLHAKPGTIGGYFSPGSTVALGDAENWDKPDTLVAAAGAESRRPVAVALATVTRQAPAYMILKPEKTEAAAQKSVTDFAAVFDAAEKHRREIAEKIVVDTPDAFINAASSALCVAADGVWDETEGTWMHGAVAWRVPLLGWRGDYIGDALGWHDRAQRFFTRWAARQKTGAIPDQIPPPEARGNLSRNETALHSNGDMSGSHYDMNLVFMDALFRHLLWTGDVAFARQMWPVIERHLAWERRLFRREFGPEHLPLYEGYCCIWASDDLWYSGGGAAHSSAYNFYQNKMAARVAKLIGEDPAPYETEAELIGQAMRKYLWLADRGWFAESKDLLGLQRTHDNPGLWTFYHTIDSELPTAAEASQMMRYVDANIAHIPIKGAGVPTDRAYFTLPTTNWMPYAWSTNNVVMAESAHTALAYWQSGRRATAFDLFKGCILDSMFMGLCPGNVGMCTQFDMARGESQRDFADGVGATSRALIEGLFGVKPDALAGELVIRPGFPQAWDHASLRHPDVELSFKRSGRTETFSIHPKFAKPMALRLEATALCDGVAGVTVNGQPAKWLASGEPGSQRITITAPASAVYEVAITWQGEELREQPPPTSQPMAMTAAQPAVDWSKPGGANADCINLDGVFNDKVTQIFKNEYLSPRSPSCSLAIPKQGYGSWCHPDLTFDVDDSGLRAAAAKNGGRISLPNGVPLQTPTTADAKNIAFVSQWDNYPREITVPLTGTASHTYLLMAGSTNPTQSRSDNGEVIVTYTDGSSARLALYNPTTWWPIDQDYVIDDYAFRYDGSIPPRVDLETGTVRIPNREDLARGPNLKIPGGAATVLDLPLDSAKQLKSLTVRALANEVVIGLMGVTLAR